MSDQGNPERTQGPAEAAPATLPNAAAAAATAALVVGAAANAIAAEGETSDGSPGAAMTSQATTLRPGRRVRLARSPRRRGAGLVYELAAAGSTVSETKLRPQTAQKTDTTSELRDWIKDNATLLSNASLLISIAALALGLLPDTGVLDPYIKAMIFGAALLLLIELHHQWPDDLQLQMFRSMALPENHSWRMTAFAFIMQVATLVFAIWAILNTPLVLGPLTAVAVVVAFRQWYFRRFRGVVARGLGVLALVAVLLLSELFMVVVWAVVIGEPVTIELWREDRPGLEINVGNEAGG